MKNFINTLKDLFIDPFTYGDWLGIFLAVLLWIVVIVILFLITGVIFYLIDTVGLTQKKGIGRITKMHFKESHTTYQTISDGTNTNVIPVYHSDSWEITVRFSNETDTINVSEKEYLKLVCNTDVSIKYVVGRISKCFYLKQINK